MRHANLANDVMSLLCNRLHFAEFYNLIPRYYPVYGPRLCFANTVQEGLAILAVFKTLFLQFEEGSVLA